MTIRTYGTGSGPRRSASVTMIGQSGRTKVSPVRPCGRPAHLEPGVFKDASQVIEREVPPSCGELLDQLATGSLRHA